MKVQIKPTGKGGQRQVIQQQSKQVWSQLQPNTWNGLAEAQKWEVVRRVLLLVLSQFFDDLD